MDALSFVRLAFLLAAAAVVVVYTQRPLRVRFLQYGSRAEPDLNDRAKVQADTIRQVASRPLSDGRNSFESLLNRLLGIEVPHRWFAHFYLHSTVCAAFWAHQIWTRGPVFELVARHVERPVEESMTTEQAILCWLLVAIQSGRRLFESAILAKASSSRMLVGHWLLGLAFYTGINVAVWIEGSPSLWKTPVLAQHLRHVLPAAVERMLPLSVFLFASVAQFLAHKHLAELPPAPDYALPKHLLFAWTLTPHYLAECLIYSALATMAAPPGFPVNLTVASAAVFVVINLGITAGETKQWYVRRFGKDEIGTRSALLPGIW